MISSVTFETAALADVIARLAKVAPSKGLAFDKASGIVIEFDPASPVPLAVMRATNLEIFCREWVNVSSWSGEAATWRLPSALVAQVIGSLPIGTGHTVTLASDVSGHSFIVNLSTKPGRTKVKFYPMDVSYYPEWDAFDPDDMIAATDIGGRIAQVEWAASTVQPELSSVYLDGEFAISTDKFKLACVPLAIPQLEEPIVIPSGLLGQVLRQTGEIRVGVRGRQFHIMPDEYTQVETVIFDTKYPTVTKILNMEFDTEVKVNRDQFIEIMTRTNAFSKGDRESYFDIYFGKEEIGVSMANQEIGLIGDAIEVPGYATHDRFKIRFTPRNIMDAVSKAPNKEIVIKYNAGVARGMVNIDGDSGYRAWVSTRAAED